MSKNIKLGDEIINLSDLDEKSIKQIQKAAAASKARRERAWNIFIKAFETEEFKTKLADLYDEYTPEKGSHDENISGKVVQGLAAKYHEKDEKLFASVADIAIGIRADMRKKSSKSESSVPKNDAIPVNTPTKNVPPQMMTREQNIVPQQRIVSSVQ